MQSKMAKLFPLLLLALVGITVLIPTGRAQKSGAAFSPNIPKTWDDAAMATLEVPLAVARYSPVHVPAEYYYRVPVLPIYQTYPIYAPGKEPPGYLEKLKQQEPVVLWDDSRHRPTLKTEADWIKAGESVFTDRVNVFGLATVADVQNPAWWNQGMDQLARFGNFIPRGKNFRELPGPATQERYSDEQLYALALYVYSLKPPPNPNKFDAPAKRGQEVFQSEGCAGCHTPPLYTNNKLTPAPGFQIPEEHKQKYDILPLSVGTDPALAMTTRRGTGYYKVPSLRGVWYRGPFEHNGSMATLEDWFDPRRLRDDYVPTGFKGYGVKTRAVKGHEFGLKLGAEDKRALIAFLRTL